MAKGFEETFGYFRFIVRFDIFIAIVYYTVNSG
jgi:hypothetical protein